MTVPTSLQPVPAAPSPGGEAAPAPAPAPIEQVGGTELSPESIEGLVTFAETGGWRETFGGTDEFPDLPPTPEPAAAPVPGAAPVAPVAAPVAPSPVPSPLPLPGVPASPAPAAGPSSASAVVPQGQPAVAPQPQPAAVPPVPGAVPVPAAAPQAQAPAPAAPAASPEPTPTAVVDPFAHVAQAIAQQEEAFITALAEKQYGISAEDHEAFMQGDTKKLSLFAARIHAGAMKSVMQTVSAYLPMVVNRIVTNEQEGARREEKFWGMHPYLDRAAHRALLPRVIQTYNQLNPTASEDERLRAVGVLVAQLNGIPITSVPPAQAPGVPVAPAAPQVRTPGRIVRQVEAPAFAPAGAGGAPAPVVPGGPPNGGPANPWSEFADYARAQEQGTFDN